MKKTVITLVLLIAIIACLVAVAGIHNDSDQSDDMSRGESTVSLPSQASDDNGSSSPDTPSTPDTSFEQSDDSSGASSEASDTPPTTHVFDWRYLSDKDKFVLIVDGVPDEDNLWDYIALDVKMGDITENIGFKDGKLYCINEDLTLEEFTPTSWVIHSVGNIKVTCELNLYEGEFVGIDEIWSYLYKIVKGDEVIVEFVKEPLFFKNYVIINPVIVAVGDIAEGYRAWVYDDNGVLANEDHGIIYVDERSDYLLTYEERLIEDETGTYTIDGIPYRLEEYHCVLSPELETLYTTKNSLKIDDLGRVAEYDPKQKVYVPIDLG